MTQAPMKAFRPPSRFETWFNAVMAFLTGIGLSFPNGYKLCVAGRKSGRIYAVMVTALDYRDRRYLVAPRGETQWVRNVRAVGTVALERGRSRNNYQAIEVTSDDKLEILAEYLTRYHKAVQRYFPLPAGSPAPDFAELSTFYPVFELQKIDA